MQASLVKAKSLALLIHMGISASIVVTASLLVYFVWYPHLLFWMDGGIQGLRILAFVEIILGPLLTFIVFAPGKPKLRQDLAIIGFLQISSFSAGMYIIHDERPLAITLTGNTFHTANNVSFDFYGQSHAYLDKFEGKTPHLLYIEPGHYIETSPLSRVKRVPDRLQESHSFPLTAYRAQTLAQGMDVEALTKLHPEQGQAIRTLYATHKSGYPDARFYKLVAKHSSSYVLFDTDTMQFIDRLPFEVGP